jgi:periplasmic divalent cation tolerance protein
MPYIIVFIAASSGKEADIIAGNLIDSKVAACVNIIPGVKSVYTWKGKKETAQGCLLLAKTKKENFPELESMVKCLHSYEIPEIISVAIDDGDEKYLNWIKEMTKNA